MQTSKSGLARRRLRSIPLLLLGRCLLVWLLESELAAIVNLWVMLLQNYRRTLTVSSMLTRLLKSRFNDDSIRTHPSLWNVIPFEWDVPLNSAFKHLIDLRVNSWAKVPGIWNIFLSVKPAQIKNLENITLLFKQILLHLNVLSQLGFSFLFWHLVFKPFILDLELSQSSLKLCDLILVIHLNLGNTLFQRIDS